MRTLLEITPITSTISNKTSNLEYGSVRNSITHLNYQNFRKNNTSQEVSKRVNPKLLILNVKTLRWSLNNEGLMAFYSYFKNNHLKFQMRINLCEGSHFKFSFFLFQLRYILISRKRVLDRYGNLRCHSDLEKKTGRVLTYVTIMTTDCLSGTSSNI